MRSLLAHPSVRNIETMTLSTYPVAEQTKDLRRSLPTSNRHKLQEPFLWGSRLLVLAAVFQTAWHFGGTNPAAIYHASILAMSSLVCSILAFATGWRPATPDKPFLIISGCFLAFAAFQCIPLSDSIISSIAPKSAQIQQDLGRKPAELLRQTATSLDQQITPSSSTMQLSVIPWETKRHLAIYAIAFAIAITTSLTFGTNQSRKFAILAVLINSIALTTWGIIQRAQGLTDLLPGFPNPTISVPFSTFIYKNAAAAFILPGLAAAMSLFYSSRLKPSATGQPKQSSSYVNRYYSDSSHILSPVEIIYLALGTLVIAGLMASLSRGAWIASLVALVLALVIIRHEWLTAKGLMVLGVLLLILGISISQVKETIQNRLEKVSIEELTQDQRLEHWKLGLTTAVQYLPWGSGLGTYGYSTLPEQTRPTLVWFEHAHNQYLEVLTETGLPGLLCLIALIVWGFRRAYLLLQPNRSYSTRGFGVFALMTLIGIAIQNLGDFVVAMPSNLFMLAFVLGLISIERSLGAGGVSTAPETRFWSIAKKSNVRQSLSLALASGAILLWAITFSRATVINHTALDSIAQHGWDEKYDDALWDSDISIISETLATQSGHASAWRQAALLTLYKYRSELIQTAASEGETITWQNTQPEMLAALLYAMPEPSRTISTKSMLVPNTLAPILAEALRNLAASLESNPLYPQAHELGLALAPLTGWTPGPWADRYESLAKCDPRKLYLSGFLAFVAHDFDRAMRNWQQSLVVSRQYEEAMCRVALTKLSPIEITIKMIPSNRPESLVTLVNIVLSPDYTPSAASLSDKRKTAQRIAESVLEEESVWHQTGGVHAANICELAGAEELACKAWDLAVRQNPKNPQYRYKLAGALQAIGDYEGSLRHANLGASLTPDNSRFDQLIQQAQARLRMPARN